MQGFYAVNNSTLSMDIINSIGTTIPLEGTLWYIRALFLDGKGAMHLCADMAGEFFRLRNRPKH